MTKALTEKQLKALELGRQKGGHNNRPSGLTYKIHKVNPTWFKRKKLEELKPSKKGYRVRRFGKKVRPIHRVLMEGSLKPGDVVHHINGIKLDNRVENLKVMTKLEHDNLHGGEAL